jgi:tRNA(Ile2) C34 agmatinyltransferase TiaS
MKKVSSEKVAQEIRCKTRKNYSSEEKVRIVLEGSITECPILADSRHLVRPSELRLSGCDNA